MPEARGIEDRTGRQGGALLSTTHRPPPPPPLATAGADDDNGVLHRPGHRVLRRRGQRPRRGEEQVRGRGKQEVQAAPRTVSEYSPTVHLHPPVRLTPSPALPWRHPPLLHRRLSPRPSPPFQCTCASLARRWAPPARCAAPFRGPRRLDSVVKVQYKYSKHTVVIL